MQIGVRSDPNMIDPDQLGDMVDMVGHMPDIGRIGGAHEHAHPGDPHHAALGRQRLDRRVGLDPRMIDQRARVAVRDRDRALGDGDCVQCRLVAAMRDVDEHALFLHFGDDRGAIIADPAVDTFGAARSDQILAVVRQLRAAQA